MVLLACNVLGMDATKQNGVPNLNQVNLIGHYQKFWGSLRFNKE